MSEAILGVVITHGDLACSLGRVSEKLVSSQIKLRCFSTQVLSSEDIIRDINKEIAAANPQRILIFVDLMGSNCWIIGNKLKHEHPEKTAVVSGANVPMLVSYLINAPRLEWDALLEKIVADAKKGIVLR